MSDKRRKKSLALRNSFGKIRLDTRWDMNTCIKNLRKHERVVEVYVEEL